MTSAGRSAGHVVLVGMMGVGKTTVGEALAARLGRPFLDSDAEVEARTGRTVREIFAAEGEAAFRALETAVLAEALARPEPAVVAAAGGSVGDPANRERLRAAGTVVWLRASPGLLAERTAGGDHRPLLEHDPAGTLARLAAEREPLYREVADLVVDVDDRPAGRLVDHLTALLRAARARCARGERTRGEGGRWISVPVTLGERSYPVVVGPGVRHALEGLLPAGTRRVAVVTQPELPVEVDPGVEHRVFLMGAGEPAKSLATVEALCRDFARWGLTRADTVVAVGGGLVTDTAGFAAAVYHRGVAVVHVATTLLAQVDAAIGGKTGVNLPEGKNLVGAFWQPSVVLCDTETLASLPERELRSGLGEVAKYHFLGAPDLDRLPMEERVAACVRIKAAVVAADEREGGRRAVLNYGHTLGHALETAGRYDLRHGEAVAVGLVYAAELARVLGRIDDARVAEHRRVVAAYGLPDRLPAGSDTGELVTLMGRDKKAVDGLTFVLDGPHGVEPVRDVPLEAVEAALARVR